MKGCARVLIAFALAIIGSIAGSMGVCTYAEHKAAWPHWADFVCGHNAVYPWILSVPLLFTLCFVLAGAPPRTPGNPADETVSPRAPTLNPFQRLVIGLAKYAGFSPVWPGWQQRLLALQGEFRRSSYERVFWYVFETLSISWGSWILALGVREYVRWGSREWWPIGAMGLGFLSTGLYAITRNGRWYRLEHGVLTALRHNGKPVWQENLAGLTGIAMARGRGGFVTTLTLRWPGHTRRLELFRSLESALSAHLK